uniref:Uncharacterized protein n=1 Tax=Caldicellulosiruptor owensensis TaxID=55205 RepID=A0A7C5V2U7_9FIRM
MARAQASYIVWKLINAVPELKNKNIPVEVRKVPLTEAFMRGICFLGYKDIYNHYLIVLNFMLKINCVYYLLLAPILKIAYNILKVIFCFNICGMIELDYWL